LAAAGLGVRVAVSFPGDVPARSTCNEVGATCLGASVGVSPDRRGRLEAARMQPAHRDARTVTIDVFESDFIDSFSTARLSTSFLMCDAGVTWTRAVSPAIVSAGAPA